MQFIHLLLAVASGSMTGVGAVASFLAVDTIRNPNLSQPRSLRTHLDAIADDGRSAAATQTTRRASPSEVVSIFDKFADNFEHALVDVLEYSAPRDIGTAASERVKEYRDGRPYKSALDAGCGTGLSGPHLYPLVSGPLIGVDLSPKMAQLAAELVVDDGQEPVVMDRMRRCDESARQVFGCDRLYDGVFTADLLDLSNHEFLDGCGHGVKSIQDVFELVVSADVLCYFGEMKAVMKALADKLEPGGDLIFSTETIAEGDYNWIRTPSYRYAHNPDYVTRMATDVGLALVSQTPFTPRLEVGEKVLGTLHIFHKALQ